MNVAEVSFDYKQARYTISGKTFSTSLKTFKHKFLVRFYRNHALEGSRWPLWCWVNERYNDGDSKQDTNVTT